MKMKQFLQCNYLYRAKEEEKTIHFLNILLDLSESFEHTQVFSVFVCITYTTRCLYTKYSFEGDVSNNKCAHHLWMIDL